MSTEHLRIACAHCRQLLVAAKLPASPAMVVDLTKIHDERCTGRRTDDIYARLALAVGEHNRQFEAS